MWGLRLERGGLAQVRRVHAGVESKGHTRELLMLAHFGL